MIWGCEVMARSTSVDRMGKSVIRLDKIIKKFLIRQVLYCFYIVSLLNFLGRPLHHSWLSAS